MKKVIFILVPILVLFFTSCEGDSSNSSIVKDLEFTVRIDYSKSIEQYLKEGHYDYASKEISSITFGNDTKDTVITRTATLIRANRNWKSEDVIAQLKLRGFRPGTATELYALGADYHQLSREISIVALGSVSVDSRNPELRYGNDTRFTHLLHWWSDDWYSEYWVLAFSN